MGEVYLAHDTELGRHVALKIPQFQADDGPEVLERFKREARSAAMLLHPNICPIHDVGEISGIHFLTMAYVEGCSLADRARQNPPIPQQQIANLICKLALAMNEAHSLGIVHRDLKPSNIMINQRNEPMVMDFGLAWFTNVSRPGEERLTQSGLALGTPAYMSPEQVKGELDSVGASSDIYSLGVIMYELLTGKLPFQGSVRSLLANILTQEPASPSSIRQDIDLELERICLKAMAKATEDRYASMTELADALAKYLGPARDTAQRRSRWRSWIAAACAIAAIVMATTLYIHTEFGTIKIELSDPAAQVQIKLDGNSIDLTGIDSPLRLRAREHGLEITGKDFETITKVFRVRSGSNKPLLIELIPRQSEPVIAETKPTIRATGAAAPRVVQRSPEEIKTRRHQYLDQHLKLLLTGKQRDAPPTINALSFPPNVKTQSEVSTDGLTPKIFRDVECTRQVDPDRAKTAGVEYVKGYMDAQSRPRQVECYDKDGGIHEGPLGWALARYWYDAKGNRIQEAFFGIDSKPAENSELVIAAHHAFDAAGDKAETRFYDAQGKAAEDRFGVHRRVFDSKTGTSEYRLDGSRRELWLPPINLGLRINRDAAWRPAITAGGQEMYFATGWRGSEIAARKGIHRVVWKGDRWSDPELVQMDGKPLGGLNPSISSDGRLMVVFGWKSSPYPHHQDIDEFRDLSNYGWADIYIREKKDGAWQQPRNAGSLVNEFDQEGGASFIPGSHSLCVSSRRIQGASCELGISDRQGDDWGKPRPLNVGSAMHPVFTPNGQRIYFSSTRKGSFGFDDIWVTQKSRVGWSRPINLGSSINGADTDDSAPAMLGDDVMYFSRCGPPWNLWVTGRADSEAAIRHMANIHALGE